VLRAVPGSRMILKANGMTAPEVLARLTEWFGAAGIARDRVDFMDTIGERVEHLAVYRKIDIALDAHPYNGATTTCEALWMGVPVVSLSADTHASRMGKSILHAAGLAELACADQASFVQTAVTLAADLGRLEARRQAQRAKIMSSALTDAAQFTRGLEAAYRTMWRTWCESR
jgi:predicted O-linked N-acetylglucosamine transferase (SPINDLY family)